MQQTAWGEEFAWVSMKSVEVDHWSHSFIQDWQLYDLETHSLHTMQAAPQWQNELVPCHVNNEFVIEPAIQNMIVNRWTVLMWSVRVHNGISSSIYFQQLKPPSRCMSRFCSTRSIQINCATEAGSTNTLLLYFSRFFRHLYFTWVFIFLTTFIFYFLH